MLSSLEMQALASIVLQIIELVLDRKGTDPVMFQQIKRELDSLQQMTYQYCYCYIVNKQ
jgi:hypothetical protein